MSIDQEKLNQFMQKAVGDLGATFHAALVVIGDKLIRSTGRPSFCQGNGPTSTADDEPSSSSSHFPTCHFSTCASRLRGDLGREIDSDGR
jgi:hypothetical protein